MTSHDHAWKSSLLPIGQDGRRSAASRPAVCPAGYRHQRANRTDDLRPGGTIARLFADFPEPAEFIEGVHHASDKSRSACFFSCAGPDVHGSRHQICRLSWCLDRHQPPAGRPLKRHRLRGCALFGTATASLFGHSGLVQDGAAGGWSSLELKRLCHAGRFSLPGGRLKKLSLSLSRLCPRLRAGRTPVTRR